MIPILCDENLQDAWDISNGLGRLSDCLSCDVVEERNGEYTMKLVYPLDGLHAEKIQTNRIIKALAGDKTGVQCFRIRSITPTLDGNKITVLCNHISYDLTYYPVKPFSGNVDRPATALALIWYNAINQNPFLVDPELYVLPSLVPYSLDVPKSTRALLMGSEGSILDLFGGEYEFDNRKVIWKRERGSDTGVVIRYGKNLMSYEQETNISEVVCGILPLYEKNGTVVYGDIQYSSNAANYPYPKTKVVDFTQDFEATPTKAQLEAAAASYITANGIGYPEISTRIEFFPIWQTPEYEKFRDFEKMGLCDTVTVSIPHMGVDLKAKVVKTDYNSLLERYNSIELGTIRRTVADVIAETSGGATWGHGNLRKLWTNNSPASAFDAQTITIDGLSKYNYFEVMFLLSIHNQYMVAPVSVYVPAGATQQITAEYTWYYNGWSLATRAVTFDPANNEVVFSGGGVTSGTAKEWMIPAYIFGMNMG